MAALREELLRMGLLKIPTAKLSAGNLRGNGQDRDAAALTVVKAVDQMQVSRTAAACADGYLTGQVSLGARGESRRLLMAHMNPLNAGACANRICYSVQGVAAYAVDPLNSCFQQHLHQQVRYSLCHLTPR